MRLLRWMRLDLVPDYFVALYEQWHAILWGASVPAVIFFLWWTLGLPPFAAIAVWFVIALFFAGYFVWRADHVRLQQKISINGVTEQRWTTRGRDAIAYYFGVVNTSEALTIHGVRVQLQQMVPEVQNLNWLPVPLRQKHDNPLPGADYARSFDLNPSEPRNIDFVSAFVGADSFDVHHVAGAGVNQSVPVAGLHRLRVMVTAEDMPVLFEWFDVWMSDEGVLQCQMSEGHP
jgi:hypothetical protein